MAYLRLKPKFQVVETIVDADFKSHNVLKPVNVTIRAAELFINIVVSKCTDYCPGICRVFSLIVL